MVPAKAPLVRLLVKAGHDDPGGEFDEVLVDDLGNRQERAQARRLHSITLTRLSFAMNWMLNGPSDLQPLGDLGRDAPDPADRLQIGTLRERAWHRRHSRVLDMLRDRVGHDLAVVGDGVGLDLLAFSRNLEITVGYSGDTFAATLRYLVNSSLVATAIAARARTTDARARIADLLGKAGASSIVESSDHSG